MSRRTPGSPKPHFDPRLIDLSSLIDEGDLDVVGIDDLPRGVRDAFEEDQQNRREWSGDLSE